MGIEERKARLEPRADSSREQEEHLGACETGKSREITHESRAQGRAGWATTSRWSSKSQCLGLEGQGQRT